MEAIRRLKALAARLAGARHRAGAEATVRRDPLRSAGCAVRASPARAHVRVTAAGDGRRTTRQRDGDEGEAFARRYLELNGLTFVAANVRYRDGELDLVMRDVRASRGRVDPVLVFVEVRRRASGSHGGAVASVTADKRRRVVAAASHFLVGLGMRALPNCRFDVVTIEGDSVRGFTVEWLRNAFDDVG